MDWIWVIIAVISIVVGLMEKVGKSQKTMEPRPWVSRPIEPSVMFPASTDGMDQNGEGVGMESVEFYEAGPWEEGSAAPEMAAPTLVSGEGESDWSDVSAEPSPTEPTVGSFGEMLPAEFASKNIIALDDIETGLVDEDWEGPGLTMTTERVVEAVIFSEVLARRPVGRRVGSIR